jgi:hypothetical protein
MFVTNCTVKTEETMVVSSAPAARSRGKRRQPGDRAAAAAAQEQATGSGDACHPVLCGVCGEKLGMVDGDEVFHFFHVLASNP